MTTCRKWTQEGWQGSPRTSDPKADDFRADLQSGGPRAGNHHHSTLRSQQLKKDRPDESLLREEEEEEKLFSYFAGPLTMRALRCVYTPVFLPFFTALTLMALQEFGNTTATVTTSDGFKCYGPLGTKCRRGPLPPKFLTSDRFFKTKNFSLFTVITTILY